MSIVQGMGRRRGCSQITLVFLVYVVAGAKWSGRNIMLDQKDSVSRSGYPVAAARIVPNGVKNFNQPVCDMLEKNAHLCSVLSAPLPNSTIHVSTNRLPLTNCRPFSPTAVQRRINNSSCLPLPAQQQCQTFSNGVQAYCGIFSDLPVTSPDNQPALRGYCESNVSLHSCCPPVNGMLVSYAETRNGYCMNTAARGMMVGHPVPCRSYGPTMHWSVPPSVSSVNSEFVCKLNGVADITVSSAPRTNTNNANLQFSAVMVSAVSLVCSLWFFDDTYCRVQ